MSDIISTEIYSKAKESSTKFDSSNEVAIILAAGHGTVSYTHLRAHETVLDLVCRLLL